MSNFLSSIPYELFSYIGGGIFLFIILYKFFPNLFIKIHKPIFFIVVPGLPTTVFILIAAWAFSKCSERFTLWLENHKIFGPIILNWKTYRGLSRRAKKLAISMIIPTFVFTIYFVFSLVGDLIFGAFGIALCTWLATRPEPPLENES
jgi:uncharacterized membrane protein YbaN (DUF454 family)